MAIIEQWIHTRNLILLHIPDVPKARLDWLRFLGVFDDLVQLEYIEASEVSSAILKPRYALGKFSPSTRSLVCGSTRKSFSSMLTSS